MNAFYKQVLTVLVGSLSLGNLSIHAQTLVNDIKPGIGSSTPEQLIDINGILYFVADDGVHGKELWKSDGTGAGTTLVKDIISGVGSGAVKNLANVNGTLIFSAKIGSGSAPNQLWKSDGTPAGTVELLDGQLNKAESKDPANLTNVGGMLYYTNTLALGGYGYTGLFRSDGTNSPGTKRLTYYTSENPNYPRISQLTDFGGTLYFIYGGELYKSTGTLVKTISSAPADNTKIQDLINVNGTLFFSADDGSSGGVRRLWKSDGTAAGTVKLADGIANPAEGPNPANLTNVNGTLYYTSQIVKGSSGYWGLFKSNGTNSPGTGFFGTFVKSSTDNPLIGTDIPYESTASQVASPSGLINVDGTLYFVFANNLWKSNGTAAGTVKVTNAVAPSFLTNVNGTLYFVSGPGSIYKTDPSTNTASSVVVTSDPTYNLTNINGTLFYTHGDPATTGVELYKLGTTPPVAQPLLLTAPTYGCTTGAFRFNTSGGDGSPITFAAIGITGPTTNPDQFVDTDLRTAADAPLISLLASQNGTTVTYVWNIRAQCPVGPGTPPVNPPTGSAFLLLTPTYNCETGAFTFNTSGGNGTPIEYRAVPGITNWTTNPSQFVDEGSRTANDVQPFLLEARQNGVVVSLMWNLKAACGRARLGAGEPERRLQLVVLGNPVVGETVHVEVSGAEGQPLRVASTNLQGGLVSEERIGQAAATERVSLKLGPSGGVYLLEVSSPGQTKVVRVLKTH